MNLSSAEAAYLAAFNEAKTLGRAWVDADKAWNTSSREKQAALAARDRSRNALVEAAMKYDGLYLENRPSLRYIFEDQKANLLLKYMNFLED